LLAKFPVATSAAWNSMIEPGLADDPKLLVKVVDLDS